MRLPDTLAPEFFLADLRKWLIVDLNDVRPESLEMTRAQYDRFVSLLPEDMAPPTSFRGIPIIVDNE